MNLLIARAFAQVCDPTGPEAHRVEIVKSPDLAATLTARR